MRNQLFIVFFFFPMILIGQSKFSFGVNYTAVLSMVGIDKESTVNSFQEEGDIAYGNSLGLTIQYDLSKELFFRSGMFYQNIKHKTKVTGLRFESDILYGSNSVVRNEISIASIGIPIDIGFKIPIKAESIDFLIGSSNSLNINLENTSKGKIDNNLFGDNPLPWEQHEINAASYSIGFFTGLEFSNSDNFMFSIEPNINLTTNKFSLIMFDSTSRTIVEIGCNLRFRLK